MSKNRTIDGSGNNHQHPDWGKAGEPLLRLTTPAYEGRNGPSGSDRPKPKDISDVVCTQAGPVENDKDLSDYMWAWGQFLDHELDLSPDDTGESFDIPVSKGKPVHFVPSRYHPATGTAVGNPRQQVNVLSAYVDGANVYGTDLPRTAVLRTFDGTRQVKTPANAPDSPKAPVRFSRLRFAPETGETNAGRQLAVRPKQLCYVLGAVVFRVGIQSR